MAWTDAFLGRFRWYRRLIGGHWEKWWIDATMSATWLRMPAGCANRQLGGTALQPLGSHGTPECETWA